jgi:hypothetical protein
VLTALAPLWLTNAPNVGHAQLHIIVIAGSKTVDALNLDVQEMRT